jgi:PAS domain S-box-containing protein
MPENRTAPTAPVTDLLFDRAGVGLCLVAPDGTVLRANAEWLRSNGFTPEQVIGDDIIDLFPGTRDVALALHARARAGHRVEVPRHVQVVNGRETLWEGSIDPVPMEGGTGLLITAREVSATGAPQQNAIITGIARIFEKALTVDSEEVLGRACLAIAEEVTQSRFAFIGEVNRATGKLDDIAISDPGWDVCRMTDQSGHGKRKVPLAFEVHGIYGRVLIDGRSVVTNDPASHPDRIGTPPGHPPLRAFLGVPLIHGTSTWGMIGVGNREGGYGPDERAALEALAPAIMQAFLHKRAEAARRDSESFYRQTLESIPGMVFTTRPDGYCDYQSQQWVDYTGVPMSEHLGDGWNTLLHPDDRPRAFDAWRAAVEGRAPYDLEYRVRRKDGEYEWFRVIGREILDPAGQVVRWFGVAMNIEKLTGAESALRASERRLGLALDAGRAAAWEVDLVGGKHFWDPRFFPLLCVPPEHREYAEQHWAEFVVPEDRARAAREFAAACEEGAGVYDSQFRARRMDGVVRWFRSRGVEVRDAGGGRRMVGFVQDITDEKESEQKLIDANEQLREADHRKDEFLGMLSHELRNPLAPIRNSTYILEHSAPGTEQARRAQTVIKRQTEHLTRLVDDLLDVNRIARGKIELRRSRVDLRDVVLHAADDFRLTMQDRGVTFRTSVPDAQVGADADATRIAQTVGNLLHNAAKFTRRGDEVTLSLATDGGEAEIRVRDTGAGIDPVLLPRVFEPFVQGERTLARTEGGLGLGLALVKGIAELHGGTVRAASAGNGRGAEFVVRLPLVDAAVAQIAAGRRAVPGRGGRRVLVVDDNADAAESLADIVGMLGHAAEIAYDGPSAIEKARANPPEIVLCDIGLPGMSGYEVAKVLREGGNGMQLFAVSGYAQPEDVNKAIEAGFDGHLAKPLRIEDVERLLG